MPTSIDLDDAASILQRPTNSAVTAAQPNPPGDPHALRVEVAAADGGDLELVGIPKARLTVSGTGTTAHLFFKLVDRESGEVVNLQETPVRVEDLGGGRQTIEVPMSGIAYTLPEGHHLDLQVSTTSVMHATARTVSSVQVQVDVEVPVRRASR